MEIRCANKCKHRRMPQRSPRVESTPRGGHASSHGSLVPRTPLIHLSLRPLCASSRARHSQQSTMLTRMTRPSRRYKNDLSSSVVQTIAPDYLSADFRRRKKPPTTSLLLIYSVIDSLSLLDATRDGCNLEATDSPIKKTRRRVVDWSFARINGLSPTLLGCSSRPLPLFRRRSRLPLVASRGTARKQSRNKLTSLRLSFLLTVLRRPALSPSLSFPPPSAFSSPVAPPTPVDLGASTLFATNSSSNPMKSDA